MTGTTETFYKREVEKYQFIKIPLWMFKRPYNKLSHASKLMYGLLYDRLGLSLTNNWHDRNGKVFQYFKNEDFVEALDCSERTVIKSKRELAEWGLMTEERQGLNLPNRIYIKGPNLDTLTQVQDLQKVQSRPEKNAVQDLQKVQTNQTEKNQTEINHNYCYKGRAFFDVYQERIGPIDGEQFGQLKELIDLDGMEAGLLVRAIGIAADNGKRNFKYIMAILNNWKRNGLLTLPAVEEADRAFQESKVSSRSAIGQPSKPNVPDWHNDDYKNETTPEELAELERKKQELLGKMRKKDD